MSDDELTIYDVIDHLQNNPDSALRAEAAQMLGGAAATLDAEERSLAKDALNQALLDPDPLVLTAAMQAISAISAATASDAPVIKEEDDAPVKAAACPVCGKPEAVVDAATCEYDDCPYR